VKSYHTCVPVGRQDFFKRRTNIILGKVHPYYNTSFWKIKEEFGVQARWNYLESGHGKGPCDGLGASVKRSADNAIKHGKASIQNTSDFFCYAQKTMEEGSSKVKYIYYTERK
jgi:hypothetical protein